ncbi:MAG: hypothetical protein AAGE52_25765 [Myxococcota bacterium]
MGEWTPMGLVMLLALFPLTVWTVWSKRPQQALLFVAFFSSLFGPEGAFFKLPLVPPLDKLSLPYLIFFLVALVRWRKKLRRARSWRGIDLLLIAAFVSGFITFLTNPDPLTYGSWRTIELPALIINDGLQLGFEEILRAGLPFLLGRALFRTRRDLIELLHFLVVAGLIQSVFIWVELRLSPQWHYWIYGYGAHSDFLQTIRWGGYRPMNFMVHGLALALFMTMSLFAATTLYRVRWPKIRRFRSGRVVLYLVVVLVLCKSTGTILYALLFIPVLMRTRPQTQLRLAAFIAAVVFLYPSLRAADWVPTEELVEMATNINADRAQSLKFRFDNEEMLLEKARERIAFGWGGNGRRSVYDDELGKEIAVADGHWIIVLGMRGAIGFLEAFGLLLIPVILAYRRRKLFRLGTDRQLVAGLALMVAVCALDLIPNGLFSNYPYLLAGALFGILQEARRRPASWAPPPPPRIRRSSLVPPPP